MIIRSIFAFWLLSLLPFIAFAQDARLLPMDNVAYQYIELLQKRGYLLELSPTTWPATIAEIRSALQSVRQKQLAGIEHEWIDRLDYFLGPKQEEVAIWVYAAPISTYSSSEKQDVLRPQGESNVWHPRAELRSALGNDQWAAQLGLTMDRYYDIDPDGVDIANRLYVRSEEAHLGFRSKYVNAYAGRFQQHWAGLNEAGVLISSNAPSYDHFRLQLGTDRVQITSSLGELDQLGPNGSFYQRERYREGGIRRFLALHRLDIRPNEHMQLYFFEAVLHSASNAGISLAYLNPMHVYVFESDNNPKNFENNLILGAGFWWQRHKTTLNYQMILDDATYENRRDRVESRTLEPTSMAISASLYQAAITPNWDAGIQFEMVGSLTYRTDQKEGQYTYAQYGLAMEDADYFKLRFSTRYHLSGILPASFVEPDFTYLKQGEGDYRFSLAPNNPDGFGTEFLFTGTASTTYRLGTRLWLQPRDWLWLKANLGYNITRNDAHINDYNTARFTGLISLGFVFQRGL